MTRALPVWSRDEYPRRLNAQRRGEMIQAVGWLGTEPVGRGMVLFPAHEEHSISARRERCAEVRDVFVTEDHRRRGVASAVMTALETAASESGHDRVGLSVSLDAEAAPAMGLYSRLGYRHAHGPYVTSTNLAGDEGPILVGAILVYLVKDLSGPPDAAAASSSLRAR